MLSEIRSPLFFLCGQSVSFAGGTAEPFAVSHGVTPGEDKPVDGLLGVGRPNKAWISVSISYGYFEGGNLKELPVHFFVFWLRILTPGFAEVARVLVPLDKGADYGAWKQMPPWLAEYKEIVIGKTFFLFLKPGDLAGQEGDLTMKFLDFFLVLGEMVGNGFMLGRESA